MVLTQIWRARFEHKKAYGDLHQAIVFKKLSFVADRATAAKSRSRNSRDTTPSAKTGGGMDLQFDFFQGEVEMRTQAADLAKIEAMKYEPKVNFTIPTRTRTASENALHERAMAEVNLFKKSEARLLAIVMEVDACRLYETFELTSTYAYCTEVLGLSEDVTCMLTRVARVSRVIPDLKSAIDDGALNLSKARRIAPVLTKENKTYWIEMAKALPQQKLEREIAGAHPGEAVLERVKPVANDRFKIELGLDEKRVKDLRRVQDLVSGKLSKPATLEDALEEMLELYLFHHDPVEKAQRKDRREQNRKSPKGTEAKKHVTRVASVGPRSPISQKTGAAHDSKTGEENGRNRKTTAHQFSADRRSSIPAEVEHAVNLRDSGACQAKIRDGSICGETRWVQYHHIQHMQDGGAHTLDNIVTLCSRHHRFVHRLDS